MLEYAWVRYRADDGGARRFVRGEGTLADARELTSHALGQTRFQQRDAARGTNVARARAASESERSGARYVPAADARARTCCERGAKAAQRARSVPRQRPSTQA